MILKCFCRSRSRLWTGVALRLRRGSVWRRIYGRIKSKAKKYWYSKWSHARIQRHMWESMTFYSWPSNPFLQNLHVHSKVIQSLHHTCIWYTFDIRYQAIIFFSVFLVPARAGLNGGVTSCVWHSCRVSMRSHLHFLLLHVWGRRTTNLTGYCERNHSEDYLHCWSIRA